MMTKVQFVQIEMEMEVEVEMPGRWAQICRRGAARSARGFDSLVAGREVQRCCQ